MPQRGVESREARTGNARLTGTGARDTSAGPNGPAPGCPDYIFTLTRILGSFIGSDGDDEVPFQLPVRNSSKPATTGNHRTRTGQSETNRATTGVASRCHRTRRASPAEARSDRPPGPTARHSLPAVAQARILAFALSLLICRRISRPPRRAKDRRDLLGVAQVTIASTLLHHPYGNREPLCNAINNNVDPPNDGDWPSETLSIGRGDRLTSKSNDHQASCDHRQNDFRLTIGHGPGLLLCHYKARQAV
jgi:hypothetical protein